MKNDPALCKNEVGQLIEKHFLPVIAARLQKQAVFIKAYDQAVKALMNRNYLDEPFAKALRHFADYKRSTEELVNSQFKQVEITDFDAEFADLNTNLILFVEGVDEVVVKDQKPERFKAIAGDPLSVKAGKRVKRIIWSITGIPLALGNGVRRIFRKPVKPRKPATHSIRFRNLSRYFLKEKLSEELIELMDVVYAALSRTSQMIWEIDKQITEEIEHFVAKSADIKLALDLSQNIPEAIKELDNCNEQIRQKAFQCVDKQHEHLLQAFDRVGTFELANRRFGPAKTARLHYQLNRKLLTKNKNWHNALLLLSDDWEIDLELFSMIYMGLSTFYTNKEIVNQRLEHSIQPELERIVVDLTSLLEPLTGCDQQSIKSVLTDQITHITGKLERQLVPHANEIILAQDLPALINAIELGINEEMKALSSRRAILKGADYNQPVRSSLINYITPGEVISFEMWPHFQKAAKACKIKITASIDRIQHELGQLAQITTFNLESALSLVDAVDETNKPADVAMEGIRRVIKRVEAQKESLVAIQFVMADELYGHLQKLNGSVKELTDNENIYQIRVRIAKAKAIDRSRKIRQEWVDRFKNLIPSVWKLIVSAYTKTRTRINELSEKYGLSRGKATISSEIADFLAETHQAIEKLPFVYQRLFKSEPLMDYTLFEGRSAELNSLNNAYTNFTKGRFAASVVVAEKGSGITTLLNFFQKDLTTSCEVHRLDLQKIASSDTELFSFLADGFNTSCHSSSEVIAFLMSGKKKIVILENLQRVFLKKVNGFEALTTFSEIISFTGKNVFWITSCTFYAWNYLTKTTKISDRFSYIIQLKEFDETLITQLINKRHQISGYNLSFDWSPDHMNNKKFKKLDESEQQRLLQHEYFASLNKIAKSNINVALMYWLRSTCKVTQNTIYIASLKGMDFTFMQSMAADKLYALLYLLLHDGLTEENFATSMNLDAIQSRAILYPLFEDGILVKEKDKFLINTLLYRQTVDLLKAKNIIH